MDGVEAPAEGQRIKAYIRNRTVTVGEVTELQVNEDGTWDCRLMGILWFYNPNHWYPQDIDHWEPTDEPESYTMDAWEGADFKALFARLDGKA